jgi:hypothetical protein
MEFSLIFRIQYVPSRPSETEHPTHSQFWHMIRTSTDRSAVTELSGFMQTAEPCLLVRSLRGSVIKSYPGSPSRIRSESAIARITGNVISWLLERGYRPLMGPSHAVSAPVKWKDTGIGPFTALAANAQGGIFLALGDQVVSRHPDLDPEVLPVSLSIEPAGTIRVMAAIYMASICMLLSMILCTSLKF